MNAYQYACGLQDCQFMVRSEDENEVVNMVQEHAQEKHGIAVDRGDIQSEMESA